MPSTNPFDEGYEEEEIVNLLNNSPDRQSLAFQKKTSSSLSGHENINNENDNAGKNHNDNDNDNDNDDNDVSFSSSTCGNNEEDDDDSFLSVASEEATLSFVQNPEATPLLLQEDSLLQSSTTAIATTIATATTQPSFDRNVTTTRNHTNIHNNSSDDSKVMDDVAKRRSTPLTFHFEQVQETPGMYILYEHNIVIIILKMDILCDILVGLLWFI